MAGESLDGDGDLTPGYRGHHIRGKYVPEVDHFALHFLLCRVSSKVRDTVEPVGNLAALQAGPFGTEGIPADTVGHLGNLSAASAKQVCTWGKRARRSHSTVLGESGYSCPRLSLPSNRTALTQKRQPEAQT